MKAEERLAKERKWETEKERMTMMSEGKGQFSSVQFSDF